MNNKWPKVLDRYKINCLYHSFPEDIDSLINAVKAFNYGGIVTNVPGKGGFTLSQANLNRFNEILKHFDDNNMEYVIYDEVGYPSGQACGLTLEGHEEFAAKALYMRKFESYIKPLKFTYEIDGISDYIACAYKYKLDISDMCESKLLIETAQAVSHDERKIEVDLNVGESIYIYIVKDAYELTHCIHNISSRRKYINLLNKDAVKHFIDIAYEPIYQSNKDAYKNSCGVFTDEPSLMVAYARDYEECNYATIAYDKCVFNEFEKKYGYDLKPYLPYLFENRGDFSKYRVDFYNLIAYLVSTSYTKQINDYLLDKDSFLTGHYLAEEHLIEHVMDYGNYVKVLLQSGYPGMDILKCLPDDFYFNAPKFLQMISRKKNSNGYMVEYCPFFERDKFDLAPMENTMGSLSILMMYGARKFHTYFMPDLSKYDEKLSKYKGDVSLEEARYMNDYVALTIAKLDGLKQINRTYVYYAIEDPQSKFKPRTCGNYFDDSSLCMVDRSLSRIAQELLPNSKEYAFFDEEDLELGLEAENIIIPEIDFISSNTVDKLREMFYNGINVYFIQKFPNTIVGKPNVIDFGTVISYDSLNNVIECSDLLKGTNKNILIQTYENNLYYIYNNGKENKNITLNCNATIFNPDTKEVIDVVKDTKVLIKSYRALLVKKS